MRPFRSFVRLTCCLLAYVLTTSLPAPPSWRAAASPASSTAAGEGTLGAAPGKARSDAPSRGGELLVRFGADVTERAREEIASAKGARRKGKLRGGSQLEKLELPPGLDAAAAAEQLRGEPGVEFAEPNFLVTRAQVTPNDVRFGEQWALQNTGQAGGAPGSDIGASHAWGTTTGSRSSVVAVIDSGIDFTHPDLQNNQWSNAKEKENGKDDDHNGFADDLQGWDWVADSGAVRDENGHGTSVAGVIAAQGDNGEGTSGVMWRASLMSLRVLDAGGTGDVAAAVEAIDYAAAMGAQVINCSWGTDAESLALMDAIERAGRRGVVVVASAGNGIRDLDTRPYYPASFDLPNLISVASSDQFDNLAPFSNWGATRVTVAAPGTDILTTKAGGEYRLVSGTSFSAPLVSGVAGLLKTERPRFSAGAIKQAVVDGSRRAVTLAGRVAVGGVVSASGALGRLNGPYGAPGGGNGNGAGNGNGRGNGNGQGGTTPRPPDPGRGSGDYRGTPPPATPRAPEGGPDLNRLRDEPSYVPEGPPPPRISSNAPPVCEDCYEAGGSDPQFSQARGLLANETGQPAVDLGSKNFNWGLPLVSLPGRAGLDLSLALYYNSLVWVKQGNAFQYNADGGYPSPGFTLGFPHIQKQFTSGGSGSYMMKTPSGARVTFRSVSTGLYEDKDGSYAQLQILAGNWARVTTTDGTQYTFEPTANGEKRCREIKDRNGNYISVYYDGAGRVWYAVDTLGRQVNFVYNGNGQLYQLTQDRAGSGHGNVLAQFAYADLYISPYFTDANGTFIPPLGPYQDAISVLTQVWVPDGHTYVFDYTVLGQVYKITRRAPDGQDLSYQWYNLKGSPDVPNEALQDVPRFTERRDWVKFGVMQQTQAVSTFYYTNAAGTVTEVHYPDGKTVYKEFFSDGSSVRAGLTTRTELWYENVLKKWTTVGWAGDAGGANPRVTEMVVEDAEGNRRRTTTEYNQGYSLPTHIREYGKVNGADVMLRMTSLNYNLDPAYVSRRVIGLPGEKVVYDGPTGYVVSKEWYMYDWGAPYFNAQAPSVQHDGNSYSSGFVVGRGNRVAVYRFSCQGNNQTCDGGGQVWAERTGYNAAGSPVWVQDALGHQTGFSYADSFSDTSKNGLGTLGYATSVTDAEGYVSTAKYDYTTGAPTETRRPSSGNSAQNNVTYETHSLLYDWAARLIKDETANNGFYTEWEYPDDGLNLKMYQNIRPDQSENYSVTVFDGAGRVRRTAAYMPGSTTQYSGRQFYFDNMGRLVQWTNPTHTTGDPNWTAAGDDAAAGWVSTSRTYDWQGRPRVTTYPDTTTTELSYGGCGCAGGGVVTSRDQRGRLKRLTHDPLGRLTKVEELDYNSAVISTAVYAYNARDQVERIRHHQGTSGAYQDRTFVYDGHGRLSSRTTPEQGTTSYSYFDDDTLHVMTDARGATQTFNYTARHLVSSIGFNSAPGVASTPNVSFAYDAAGNRTQMTDGVGTATYHYDSLSRMDWEGRTFAGLTNTFVINYGYNNAGLASVTNPSELGSSRVDYNIDHTGATTSVTGSGHWSPSTYVQNIQYRAFGGVKAASYGNGRSLSVTYTNMLRLDTWGVSGVTGWKYYYSDFGENTGRVTYAQNTYDTSTGGADPRLDRSYDYDQVGRLFNSYTGTEAKAHTGRTGGQWGVHDGPYSQAYIKDVWGNVTQKMGRAGDPDQFTASYTNNRRNGFWYDAAGNLTFDGGQHFTYDATGQQVYVDWPNLWQFYDGDRLRVKKTEGGANTPTYYLRSSVLGGQVVAEINASGTLQRGYVYDAGGGLLATLSGGVSWVYQDAATKSQRLADSVGNVYAGVDLDPWGRETARSWNSQAQPRRYTSYTRDSNDSDEAMHRRYNRWHLRFDQPDPADFSYDLTDPQSFNRYSYTDNDPVNLTDPSGLMPMIRYSAVDAGLGWGHFADGFWGYSEGRLRTRMLGHPTYSPELERNIWWGGVFTWDPWQGFFVQTLRTRLEKHLTERCTNFLNSLFAKLAEQNPNRKPVSSDIRKLFEMVQSQKGFSTQPGTISTVNGSLNRGSGQVVLGRSTKPHQIGVQVIHELVHLAAGNSWYSDRDVALAVQQMYRDQGNNFAASQLDKIKPDDVKRNSDWWSGALGIACRDRTGEME